MKEGREAAGYFADDLQMIASLGAASGYMAVMVSRSTSTTAHRRSSIATRK